MNTVVFNLFTLSITLITKTNNKRLQHAKNSRTECYKLYGQIYIRLRRKCWRSYPISIRFDSIRIDTFRSVAGLIATIIVRSVRRPLAFVKRARSHSRSMQADPYRPLERNPTPVKRQSSTHGRQTCRRYCEIRMVYVQYVVDFRD